MKTPTPTRGVTFLDEAGDLQMVVDSAKPSPTDPGAVFFGPYHPVRPSWPVTGPCRGLTSSASSTRRRSRHDRVRRPRPRRLPDPRGPRRRVPGLHGRSLASLSPPVASWPATPPAPREPPPQPKNRPAF